ncbi:MAG: TRAP transporter large permease [Synergistaceae bacterium]|nr:TRAP transporter large permease [Synergistaceae bacterium]
MAGIVFFVFLFFLAMSVPIAISMIVSTLVPLIAGAPGASSIQTLIQKTFSGADSTPIIAIPLFILGGVLMAEGGISEKLFNVFAYFVGKRRAGMPIAVIMTCLFYGAISGSGPATTAAVGGMTIPLLVSLGYDKRFCTAMVAVSGGLGVIIPPSIPFVLYSLATGVSTGALFLAGVLPGFFIGVCLMVHAIVYCTIYGEDKEKIMANYNKLHEKGFWPLFKESFWAFLSPIIILGGIYTGIVTPTEAACISIFYALFIALFVYKSIKYSELWGYFGSAVRTYAPLCFLLAFATAFGRMLALIKAPAMFSNFILTYFTAQWHVLLVIVIIFYFLGMVMDTGPAILIMAPILLPLVTQVGVNPVHFGVIMVTNLAIGLSTPPFGLDLFVASGLIKDKPIAVSKPAIPFIIAFTFALLVIVYVPKLSLTLLGM